MSISRKFRILYCPQNSIICGKGWPKICLSNDTLCWYIWLSKKFAVSFHDFPHIFHVHPLLSVITYECHYCFLLFISPLHNTIVNPKNDSIDNKCPVGGGAKPSVEHRHPTLLNSHLQAVQGSWILSPWSPPISLYPWLDNILESITRIYTRVYTLIHTCG